MQATSQLNFVHLRARSDLSLSEGLMSVENLVSMAKAQKMPAIALNDLNKTSGLIRLHRLCVKESIKPISSVEVNVRGKTSSEALRRVILIATNKTGYFNLNRLLSKAHFEGLLPSGLATLSEADLLEPALIKGLVLLSGFKNGLLSSYIDNEDLGEIHDFGTRLKAQWGSNFYLEVQRDGSEYAENLTRAHTRLAKDLDLPLVATHPVQFAKKEDFILHQARVCISEGKQLNQMQGDDRFLPSHHFVSAQQMIAAFSDMPEAIANTLKIAEQCEHQIELGRVNLPEFPTPKGLSADQFIEKLAKQGLASRLINLFPSASTRLINESRYSDRLNYELEIIRSMGFSGYFLIVQDFVNWSKRNEIPVGPGRGSGVGSLVAYCLGITEIDPVKHQLLFERFLNPERVSMPDFDIDLCKDRRGDTINYVRELYGESRATQIAAFGTLKAKSAMKDMARVLGMNAKQKEAVNAVLPSDANIDLVEHYNTSPRFRALIESDQVFKDAYSLASRLMGVTRNISTHPGGVVIAPSEIENYSAIYLDSPSKGASTSVMLDKDDIELAGLVKFDLLGLKNLTVIDKTLSLINLQRIEQGDTPFKSESIPKSDPLVLQCFAEGNTMGVFQSESSGAIDLSKRLRPTTFEDVVALMALNRPGPLQSGMVDDFVGRKEHIRAKGQPDPAWYLHPLLKEVLSPTYGVIVYQEQVMQVAQIIAGYTLGQADILRRAMGKKKPEEMAAQRRSFVEGAKSNGISEELSIRLFDLMEKFAEYGFNKSHSVAYARIACQTAWLKVHYPLEYFSAAMSVDCGETTRLQLFINDLEQNCFVPTEDGPMPITVVGPNVNASRYEFSPIYPSESQPFYGIQYGLGAIKGIGQGFCDAVVGERLMGGEYRDYQDFVVRNVEHLQKNSLTALINSGALDCLSPERAMMITNVENILSWAKSKQTGSTLLGSTHDGLQAIQCGIFTDEQFIQAEKEALGFNLQFEKITQYRELFERALRHRLISANQEIESSRHSPKWFGGLLESVKIRPSKHGDMALGTLNDGTAQITFVAFNSVYEQNQELFKTGQALEVLANVEMDTYRQAPKLLISAVRPIDRGINANEGNHSKDWSIKPFKLQIEVPSQLEVQQLKVQLTSLCSAHNSIPVEVVFHCNGKKHREMLPEASKLTLDTNVLKKLKAVWGEHSVKIKPLAKTLENPIYWCEAVDLLQESLDASQLPNLAQYRIGFLPSKGLYAVENRGGKGFFFRKIEKLPEWAASLTVEDANEDQPSTQDCSL